MICYTTAVRADPEPEPGKLGLSDLFLPDQKGL